MKVMIDTIRNFFRSRDAFFCSVCFLLILDAWRTLFSIPEPSSVLLPGIWLDGCLATVAGMALLLIGRYSATRPLLSDRAALTTGAICGFLFFARDLGFALANPTRIGWLLTGDWAQHWSGWTMFRSTPWTWPLGVMPELFYPVGSSIVYTDSLPLLALPLKLLSPALSHPFQYIGIWLLLNCLLQGALAALLVARIDRRPLAVVSGSMLFLLAPIFLRRLGHDSLMSQWLILAAFWLYFANVTDRRRAALWVLLTGISALIHPYMVVMVLCIQAGHVWTVWVQRPASDLRQALAALAMSVVLAVSLWYASGAFIIPAKDGGGGIIYGRYSFNLLGFINPMGYSRFMPDLPVLPDQYEGFAYLGVGGFVLLALAAGRVAYGRVDAVGLTRWGPLVGVAVLLAFFAASSVLTVGKFVLVNWPISNPILGVFRSSGRFIWIAFYVCTLWSIWAVLRSYSAEWSGRILVTCLFLQIADFSVAHAVLGDVRFGAQAVPRNAILHDDGAWDALAQGKTHLTMLPPLTCGQQAGPYLPFLLFAAKHSMTLNTGFLARWNSEASRQYCAELKKRMRVGDFAQDELFVVAPGWNEELKLTSSPLLSCHVVDDFTVCQSSKSEQ